MAEFLNLTWSGNAGNCWDCGCSPCCGDPCNFMDGLTCCLGWYCCGACHLAKWHAKTVDQDCALINHCLPAWCFGCIIAPIVRRNVRVGLGVGKDDVTHLVGDFLMVCCCGICSMGQMLRSANKDDWNAFPEISPTLGRVSVEPFKMLK